MGSPNLSSPPNFQGPANQSPAPVSDSQWLILWRWLTNLGQAAGGAATAQQSITINTAPAKGNDQNTQAAAQVFDQRPRSAEAARVDPAAIQGFLPQASPKLPPVDRAAIQANQRGQLLVRLLTDRAAIQAHASMLKSLERRCEQLQALIQMALAKYYPAPASGGGFANPMTALGDTIYENATPAPARLAGDTGNLRVFLAAQAIAGVAQAPGWTPNVAQTSVYVPTQTGNISGTPIRIVSGSPLPAGIYLIGIRAETTVIGTNSLYVELSWTSISGVATGYGLGPISMAVLGSTSMGTAAIQIHTDGSHDLSYGTFLVGGAGGTYDLDIAVTKVA